MGMELKIKSHILGEEENLTKRHLHPVPGKKVRFQGKGNEFKVMQRCLPSSPWYCVSEIPPMFHSVNVLAGKHPSHLEKSKLGNKILQTDEPNELPVM